MAGESNLKPWQPGQSGNPSGRPKKQPITDFLRAQLEAPIPPEMRSEIPQGLESLFGDTPTFGQLAAFKLITQAMGKGDVFAFKEILDRVEGKVTQNIAGDDGGPLQFVLSRAGKR